jgi:hypothetical protein
MAFGLQPTGDSQKWALPMSVIEQPLFSISSFNISHLAK